MAKCTLTKTTNGMTPKQSINAFKRSYYATANFKTIPKHLSQLNNELHSEIGNRLQNSKIKEFNSKNFYLETGNNKVYLKNNTPNNIARKYEYGSGNKQAYPHMRPAARKIGDKIGKIVVNDAVRIYNSQRAASSFSNIATPYYPSSNSMMNKYSKFL